MNVCDPVEVDLLYNQSVTDVFEGKIHVTKADAVSTLPQKASTCPPPCHSQQAFSELNCNILECQYPIFAVYMTRVFLKVHFVKYRLAFPESSHVQ